MAILSEVMFRVNQLNYDARSTVTTSAKNLFDLFSGLYDVRDKVKTLIITNLDGSNIIYFGKDVTVTTSNAGGIIFPKNKVEIPLVDVNYTPYFIAGTNVSVAIEVWG